MPPIVSTDWRRCIFPPNQLFLYFTTTKVIEKASNYKVLFNNVYRLAAAPLNCCKLRATRLASEMICNATRRQPLCLLRLPGRQSVAVRRAAALCVSYVAYVLMSTAVSGTRAKPKTAYFSDAGRVALSLQQLSGAAANL